MVNTKCADGEFFCKDSCIGCLPYSLGGYMTFFHASQIKGIQVLEPRISNHNLPLIYFSGKRENVLVYLSNAVEKTCKEKNFQYTGIWHKWGSYGFTQDGRLQYDEYYPNALADTYKGVSGYIYSCNHLEKCEKGNIGIPDVYVSSVPVKVDFCEYIEDAYTELLLAEEKGLIKIVRYEKFIQKGEAWLRKVIREEYENNFDHSEYQFFLKCKFSEITIHCENISINSPGSH